MEKIKLFKKRTLGETIGTAFELLRQNIRIISMSFLVFVMPLVLLSMLTVTLGIVGTIQQNTMMASSGRVGGTFIFSIIFGYFAYIVTFFIAAVVLHEVIICYEASENPKRLRVSDIWKQMKIDMGRIVGSFFALILFGIMVGIVSGIITILMSSISSSAGGLAVLITYLGSIYIQISMSNYLMLTLRSEYSVFTAIGKSMNLTAGKWRWWRTLGIYLILAVVVMSLYLVSFITPFGMAVYIYVEHAKVTLERSDMMTGVYVLVGVGFFLGGSLLAYFLNVILIGTTVNYYSLIEEKEHVGLYIDIEHMGIHDTAAKTQEGEY